MSIRHLCDVIRRRNLLTTFSFTVSLRPLLGVILLVGTVLLGDVWERLSMWQSLDGSFFCWVRPNSIEDDSICYFVVHLEGKK